MEAVVYPKINVGYLRFSDVAKLQGDDLALLTMVPCTKPLDRKAPASYPVPSGSI